MKKKYFELDFFEFLLVFFVFIIPPLFVNEQNTVVLNIHYPLVEIFSRACVLIYLLIRMYDIGLSFRRQSGFFFKVLCNDILKSIGLYALLVITGIIVNTITQQGQFRSPTISAQPPGTLLLWVWFIFSIIVMACFEEIVFRQFLPEKCLYYFRHSSAYKTMSSNVKTVLYIIIELFFICSFAIGHKYLGSSAILSAFISGVILRVSVNKFKNIIPACIAHSINNIVSFLVVFYLF